MQGSGCLFTLIHKYFGSKDTRKRNNKENENENENERELKMAREGEKAKEGEGEGGEKDEVDLAQAILNIASLVDETLFEERRTGAFIASLSTVQESVVHVPLLSEETTTEMTSESLMQDVGRPCSRGEDYFRS